MGTGITEIISQFAGYFHLHNEVARLRLNYDEFMAQRHAEEFDSSRHEDNLPKHADLDEITTTPRHFNPDSPPPEFLAYDSMRAEAVAPSNGIENPPGIVMPAHHQTDGSSGGSGGGGFGFSFPSLNLNFPLPGVVLPPITVTYAEGGDQIVAQAYQQNMLSDDDQFAPDGSAIASLQTQDIQQQVDNLNAEASAALPPELQLESYETSTLIAFASERDAAWKESGETTKGDVLPGVYVDNELQPVGAELPTFPRAFDEETKPQDQYPTDVAAQIDTLGSNLVANSAAIVDVNHAIGTLIVQGDYFRTEAIVQANVYADNDSIEYAGAGSFDIQNAGNEALNIASFLETSFGVPSFAGSNIFSGTDWHVDMFEGDLYDVHSIVQSNTLYDNDITLQTAYETNFQLLVGANEQGNFANFVTLSSDYDLVIVLGDYHEINFIYQKNVLLDPDTLKMIGYDTLPEGDGATDPLIASGGNWLQNDASIEQFGTSSYQTLTPTLEDLIAKLNEGLTQLDGTYGLGLPNFNDPTFDVLVISGSVYDINAITQENIVADADVAVQALPDEAAESDPVMQVASAGDNVLGNFASIAHTGPAADYYIGGDLYEDEMLIQLEVVAADDDSITKNDPDQLASELVAFTSPPDGAGATEENVATSTLPAGHHDLLGNALA